MFSSPLKCTFWEGGTRRGVCPFSSDTQHRQAQGVDEGLSYLEITVKWDSSLFRSSGTLKEHSSVSELPP